MTWENGEVLAFAKGHGTRNDFVLVTDADDARPLTPEDVRFLCDRRGGIGGDGVLRAVRARHVAGWDGDPDLWFMDYRNADGSIAEMCGNGVRVFARYLMEEGLVPDDTAAIPVATRAGLRTASLLPDGRVRVAMGAPALRPGAHVSVDAEAWDAVGVDVGNPHAVVLLDSQESLMALDLQAAPLWEPLDAYPQGVNVEFIVLQAPRHVLMRVYERGVGETESCGTGTVAAALAASSRVGEREGSWRVDVPGGSVDVEFEDGQAWLTGPAVIVARGNVLLPDREHA